MSSANSILNFFPKKQKPRDVQKYTLLELQKRWHTADIFVVNLPVASGKSSCAISLAHWQKSASIITPTKLLVNQYKTEYPYLHVLKAKGDYYCDTMRTPLNKRPPIKGSKAKLCPKSLYCDGCDQYREDLRKARVLPYLLSNYYIYLAHSLYRDTLIIDEAHLLIPMLKKMAAKKLWKFEYKWPDYIRNRDQLKKWINSLPPEAFTRKGKASGETSFGIVQDRLIFLKDELNSYRPRFLIYISKERHRDEERECILMEPLDIKDAPPLMWPAQVKKIILMSATINRKDIEQLGMAGKKVQYIEADSPITAERRPVVVPLAAKSMAYKNQPTNIKHLANFITETALHHEGTKGIVHTTYSLSLLLKEQKFPPEISDRIIFHSKKDKTRWYVRRYRFSI
jgi:Rad3-related DNA helicase